MEAPVEQTKLTPLQAFMQSQNFDAAGALGLVQLGSDKNTQLPDGTSLLHLLVAKDRVVQIYIEFDTYLHEEAIDELVSRHGAKVDIRNNQGLTPLAALLDSPCFQPGQVLQLLRLGADPNTVNSKREPLLHVLARSYGYVSFSCTHYLAIQLLVQRYRINVDCLNASGQTALQCIMPLISVESTLAKDTAVLLLELGAKAKVKDANGKPLIFHLLKDNGRKQNENIITLLKDKLLLQLQ